MPDIFWGNGYFSQSDFKDLISQEGSIKNTFKATLSNNRTLFINFEPDICREDNFLLIEYVSKIIEENNASHLAINLKNVKWLDSSSIGTIVSIRKSFDGPCCIYNLNPQLLEIFKILKLDLLLKIFQSENEALDYLNEAITLVK